MNDRYQVSTVFRAIDRVTAPMRRMEQASDAFRKRSIDNFRKINRYSKKVSGGVGRLAKSTTMWGTAAGYGLVKLLTTGADFEQQMVNVAAVTMQSREEIAKLEQQARKLGGTTIFTPAQIGEAQEVIRRAGYDIDQTFAAIPGTLSATAAAGEKAMKPIAEIIVSALAGFQMDPSDANRVANVLTVAASKTKSTILTLGESLSLTSGPMAQYFGPEGFEPTVAMLAQLQHLGLDPSVAATAVRGLFTQITAPGEKTKKLMRRLGVEFADLEGNMKKPLDVLNEFVKAFDQIEGNMNRGQFVFELLGLRAQMAALPLEKLMRKGELNQFVNTLKGATNEAEVMAALRLNTVRGSITLFFSALANNLIALFDQTEGPLKAKIDEWTSYMVEKGPEVFTDFGAKIGDFFENIDKIAKVFMLLAKIAAHIWVIAKIIGVVGSVVGAILAIGAAPIWVALVVVIGAIVGLVSVLFIWFDKFRNWATGKLLSLLEWVSTIYDRVASLFGGGNDDDESARPARPIGLRKGPRLATPLRSDNADRVELTLRDESGRLEITKRPTRRRFNLEQSGAFS